MIIKKIKAKKIKNSRGEDTIKVEIKADKGKGEGSAPGGASTGKHAIKPFKVEIKQAIKEIEKLKDIEINTYDDLKKIEEKISHLGSNPVIAAEFAALHCLGSPWKLINKKIRKIPKPLGNVVGGGKHFKGKSTEFQEFLLLPYTSKKLDDSINANNKIHDLVKKKLKKKDASFEEQLTDEGAWVTSLSNEEVLDLIKEEIKEADLSIEIRLGLDIAASSFWDGAHYVYRDKKLTPEEQIKFVSKLIEKYKLQYVEDPLHEEDFEGFAKLTKKFKDCMIVGDDLTVTNPERLKKAIEKKSINAIIIKPNQIGSLIKTKEVVELAKKNKIISVVSHRSGETLDATISHLAVGFEAPIIKCGIYGKERVVKLKELKKIEKEIIAER